MALGDPNDYVPPGGAAREYFADEQWIAEFRKLAGCCRFLIVRAGKSENLQRELSMLRELSLLDKLFIVTARHRPLAHSAEILGYLFRAADVAAVFAIDHGGGADGLRVSGTRGSGELWLGKSCCRHARCDFAG